MQGNEENIQNAEVAPVLILRKTAGQGFRTGLVFGLIVGFVIILFSSPIREGYYWIRRSNLSQTAMTDKDAKRAAQREKTRIRTLQARLDNLIPNRPYMIINTVDNRFQIKSGKKLLHEGVCSTGSYTLLQTQDGEETWLFKTPRGMFRVRNVLIDPIWRMPDWAFIEEGKPVPPPDSDERLEYGVLGDYAFDIGSGYLIHGTLYQRFLGLPVTHGCVRLGDEDLKKAHKYIGFGSNVFIY